jgi:hypothetical protein
LWVVVPEEVRLAHEQQQEPDLFKLDSTHNEPISEIKEPEEWEMIDEKEDKAKDEACKYTLTKCRLCTYVIL